MPEAIHLASSNRRDVDAGAPFAARLQGQLGMRSLGLDGEGLTEGDDGLATEVIALVDQAQVIRVHLGTNLPAPGGMILHFE